MDKYSETVEWLFSQIPQFQRLGAGAYKPGLATSHALDEAFGHPHKSYPIIHVGGTNGKGSTSHTLAAILQAAGYRTGLYTSPHLADFRERIRVNGEKISREAVVSFIDRYREKALGLEPSFFELTSTMAFEYFKKCDVDVAVIEVGLGGRLDSTNIVTPVLSVITNISFDHTAFLGNTLPEIAAEKAGIIKDGVPVVIGEAEGDVRTVFESKAAGCSAPITFAQDTPQYASYTATDDCIMYHGTRYGDIKGELAGDCQIYNTATILAAVGELRAKCFDIHDDAVIRGFAEVVEMTGLTGRWMRLSESPRVICDTGHNVGGWQYIGPRLCRIAEGRGRLHIVLGFVSDKDFGPILDMLPDSAVIYYTQAQIPRALDCNTLAESGRRHGHAGVPYPHVIDAYRAARSAASPDDTIFVGGSTFVVADLLSSLEDSGAGYDAQ